MSEFVKFVLAVGLGLALGQLFEWMNAPWWVVVPLIVGCLVYGWWRTIRKADSTYVDVYYDQRQG